MTRNDLRNLAPFGLARGCIWPQQVGSGRRREMGMSATSALHGDRIPARVPTFSVWNKIEGRHKDAKPRGRTCHIGRVGGLDPELTQSSSDRLCTLKEVGIYGFAVC